MIDEHATDGPPKRTNRKPSEEILERIAANIRDLRIARQYTQERLGKLCGMNKNYISNVEQARINLCLSNIEAIANGLGVEPWEIVRERPWVEDRKPFVGTAY